MSKKHIAEITADSWPQELRALPDIKERRFVEAYVKNGGNSAQAARDAGYECTNARSFASVGWRLLKREHVHDAILAFSKRYLRSMAPKAVNVVRKIMDDASHKDRLASAKQILNRIDPEVQHQDINFKHEIVDHRQEALTQLRTLKALGVARDKLEEIFGFSGLPMLERQLEASDAKANIIEADYVEIAQPAEEFLDL